MKRCVRRRGICSPSCVRPRRYGRPGRQRPDPAPWQALAGAGALAVLVPHADGGLGLDETYLVPILEEAGRVALPHPLTETALVAAPLGVVGPMVATDLGAAGSAVASATFAEAFLLVVGRGLRLYEAHEVDVEPVGDRRCLQATAGGCGPEPRAIPSPRIPKRWPRPSIGASLAPRPSSSD